MDIPIIYEDDFLLALHKPAGMVVNRSQQAHRQTVQEWLVDHVKVPREEKVRQESFDSRDSFYQRSGIVHRLDKDTSGVLLVAKNPEIFAQLQKQFLLRLVKKEYCALVHGDVSPPEGEIRAPVGRLPWNRMRFGVFAQARDATTSYYIKKHLKYNDRSYTLLQVMPLTGRTHQIRVHCAWIGHSIVSDPLYAGRSTLRFDHTFCPRMFLHAYRLAFMHPFKKELCTLSCQLPADLANVLKLLH